MQNELPNGSFEQLSSVVRDQHGSPEAVPEGWQTHDWAGNARFRMEQPGRTGMRCVSVEGDGVDAAWTTVVPVSPFARYRLSGWIKTSGVQPDGGQGAAINLHGRPERTTLLVGENDWTEVSFEFDTGWDDAVRVNCVLGYFGRAKGKAWFDDLRLERLSQRRLEPRVVVYGDRQGEAIPKYIYGQFIEHMGKCIYGGIWAEMLEDRKFFLPVGSPDSPWRVEGTAQVTMVQEKPFVGDHSPRVLLPGGERAGITQAGITVAAGKRYIGRIWLAGDSSATPIWVSLVWGEGTEDRETVEIKRLTPVFEKHALKFTAGASTENARFEVVSRGGGSFTIGCASLMPEDNVRGMRRDTLRLLKELNAPIYRWPGGNFVSGYDWREGIGDPDRRPPRKNPAWPGLEMNDFGTHEFMDFCREVGAEPLIVVNTGLGDAHSAAQWVEYVNGAPDTPMGKLRAANGRKEPWDVTWWGIGNEMYGDWQLGHMSLEHYVVKHNEVVKKMRSVDSSIKTIAVGDVGRWSEGMLTHCANTMDLISEHFYCGEKPGVMSHVRQIPDQIRAKAEAHREYRRRLASLEGKDIRIAMDEWNYWHGPHKYGYLGCQYHLRDALGIAAGLHEFFRNTDIIAMANYAQTVNVIGCIKTTPLHAAFDSTGLVLKLYRQHYGHIPLTLEGTPEPLDVAAAITQDGNNLTVGVVNPTAQLQVMECRFEQLHITGDGKAWVLSHSDPMAFNEPGQEPQLVIREQKVSVPSGQITVEPYSVNLFVFPIRR